MLVIGFASGHVPKVALNVALVKNLTLHGVYWGSYQQHNARLFRCGCAWMGGVGGGGRQAWVRQEGLRTVEGQRGGDAAPHCLTTKHRLRRCRRSLEEVALLLAQGAVSVNVSHRLALEDAPEAFQVMLSRQVCGAVRCRGGH